MPKKGVYQLAHCKECRRGDLQLQTVSIKISAGRGKQIMAGEATLFRPSQKILPVDKLGSN